MVLCVFHNVLRFVFEDTKIAFNKYETANIYSFVSLVEYNFWDFWYFFQKKLMFKIIFYHYKNNFVQVTVNGVKWG